MEWMTMQWIYFGLLAGAVLGLYDLATKAALRQISVASLTFWSALVGAIPFLLWMLGTHKLPLLLQPELQLWVLPKSMAMTGSWLLAYLAVQHLPISIAAPVRASGPLWTLCGGMVVFGDVLTPTQWAGLGICIVAYWWFSVIGRHTRLAAAPSGRWIVAMLAATCLSSLTTVYDKFLLSAHSPVSFPILEIQAVSAVQRAVLAAIAGHLITGWTGGSFFKLARTRSTLSVLWVVAVGLTWVGAEFIYFLAVSDPLSSVTTLAILRRTSLLIAVGAGAWFFGEPHIRPKLLASVLLVGGMVAVIA